ncbi:MAG: hypothetical protein OXC95_16295 [Dehalococcoidia bacterium]|nr:hypothetical protein [Dehalococcoidia bacterium]
MRILLAVVGIVVVLAAFIVVYLLFLVGNTIADFCALVAALHNAFLIGENLVEAVQTFLDAVTDDMISGLPEDWQGPAVALVSAAEGIIGLSGFLLHSGIDLIGHELEKVNDLCVSYPG